MIEYQIIESPFGDVLLGWRSGKIVFCHFALPSLEAVLERVRSDFPGEEIVSVENLLCPADGGCSSGVACFGAETCLGRGDSVREMGNYSVERVTAFTFDELLKGRGSIFAWEDLQLRGTELQVAVWREIFNLLPDELITYSQLAARCGYPRAVRAVASAVGKNPISLIIPCHKVVRSEAFVHRGGVFAPDKANVVKPGDRGSSMIGRGAGRNCTERSAAGKRGGNGLKINVSKLGNYEWGKELKIRILEWEGII